MNGPLLSQLRLKALSDELDGRQKNCNTTPSDLPLWATSIVSGELENKTAAKVV